VELSLWQTRSAEYSRGLSIGNRTNSSIEVIINTPSTDDFTPATDIQYNWYKDINNDGIANGTLEATTNDTSYTFTGLDQNITYEFYATALDTSGNESAPSDIVSSTVGIDAPAPNEVGV